MLGDTWRLWLDSGGVDDETSTWRWELLDPVTDSDSDISPAWRWRTAARRSWGVFTSTAEAAEKT